MHRAQRLARVGATHRSGLLRDLEKRDVLFTAAETLDSGEASTVFDAVHLADAFHRGAALHTADRMLVRMSFPTSTF